MILQTNPDVFHNSSGVMPCSHEKGARVTDIFTSSEGLSGRFLQCSHRSPMLRRPGLS